jgi:GMP synthase (glutamine-hydrolysing)
MTSRILAVLHGKASCTSRIGRVLRARGFEIEPCRPVIGQPLPDRFKEYAGVVIFGGPMGVNDTAEHPFLKTELD